MSVNDHNRLLYMYCVYMYGSLHDDEGSHGQTNYVHVQHVYVYM